jgi:fructokinase
VHVGSIGAALEPGATLVERLVTSSRPSATISFDPNVRPQLMGSAETARPRIERLVALADIVKASDEDLAWLYPGADVTEVVDRWLALGPALMVDTIGAGDSFMAGLLAALSDRGLLGAARRSALRELSASDLTEVVGFAARCAAITVSRPGADPPTRADLAEH